jgi:HPt (histidine-containing phosphotransfer) domain-containing protein
VLDQAAMAKMLGSVWRRHEQQVAHRLDAIERALIALGSGALEPRERMQGVRAAHVLAGSVGTFGLEAASTSALLIEHELEHPSPSRAPAMIALLDQMRSELAEG